MKIEFGNYLEDKPLGSIPLGGKPDDIDKVIGDSIRLCLNIMDKKVNALVMKGE